MNTNTVCSPDDEKKSNQNQVSEGSTIQESIDSEPAVLVLESDVEKEDQ